MRIILILLVVLKSCSKLLEFNYFEKFNLKTNKKIVIYYGKIYILKLLQKDHLKPNLRIELLKKSKLINKYN